MKSVAVYLLLIRQPLCSAQSSRASVSVNERSQTFQSVVGSFISSERLKFTFFLFADCGACKQDILSHYSVNP